MSFTSRWGEVSETYQFVEFWCRTWSLNFSTQLKNCRMSLTPRAGTGESLGQIQRNIYPSMINLAHDFSVYDAFFVKIDLPLKLLPRPKRDPWLELACSYSYFDHLLFQLSLTLPAKLRFVSMNRCGILKLSDHVRHQNSIIWYISQDWG